ncbi:hypothetical protein GJAV_G00039080 [Gymnothorax javanicus]|nr:hypothetical protein GJAV_G00039080 [Gymnothorax javanicus]
MIVYAIVWVTLCGTTYADSHRLKYIYTFVFGVTDSPEFTVEGFVDHKKFVNYDTNTKWLKPETEWIKANVGADYWERQTQILLDTQQAVQNQSRILFRKTHGAQSFQYMYGCLWNDENGLTDEFDELVYKGESFSRLDLKTQNFIAPVQQVFKTAMKLYCGPDGCGREGQNRTHTCIEWLRKYLNYKRRGLEGKVPPKVSPPQNISSPVVISHMTEFNLGDTIICYIIIIGISIIAAVLWKKRHRSESDTGCARTRRKKLTSLLLMRRYVAGCWRTSGKGQLNPEILSQSDRHRFTDTLLLNR